MSKWSDEKWLVLEYVFIVELTKFAERSETPNLLDHLKRRNAIYQNGEDSERDRFGVK